MPSYGLMWLEWGSSQRKPTVRVEGHLGDTDVPGEGARRHCWAGIGHSVG